MVRVHAVGVNPVETYIRSGIYPKPPTPYTPGNDGAGVIAAIGPDVKSVAVGDQVYIAGSSSGTYAELSVCSAKRVYHFPNQPHSPTVLPSTCRMARRITPCSNGHMGLPASVLVHGASGGGHCGRATRPCCWHDGHWHGRDGAGKKLVLEQGAHHVLDHTASGYLEQVMSLTEGRGVDVILEMLANVNLGNDLNVLARGGRVATIGNAALAIRGQPPLARAPS